MEEVGVYILSSDARSSSKKRMLFRGETPFKYYLLFDCVYEKDAAGASIGECVFVLGSIISEDEINF